MEAAIFDAVQSALLEKGPKRLRLNLSSSGVSRVNKVIWSVWDYIIGPDINFVWEIQSSSKSPTPLRSASPTSNSSNLTGVAKVADDCQRADESVIQAEIHVCSQCGQTKCECPTTSITQETFPVRPDNLQLLEDVKELSFTSSEITTGMDEILPNSCDSAEPKCQVVMGNEPEDRSDRELTDESYVALHSLSSEICRLRVETTAVDFKVAVLAADLEKLEMIILVFFAASLCA